MRSFILALALFGLAGSSPVRAQGLLIPTDQKLPPLSLTSERVKVTIEGPVATTTMHESYRNRSGRDLEAEFIFPLPPGATVRDFSMWVAGKRYKGEAVEASKARDTYEDIVRRLQDPGLLEYMGRDLWKARVYPVPRNSEQEIEITFSAILPLEADMLSYQYRVRGGPASRSTVKDFTLVVQIHSPDPLGPIYSPSHDVAVDRRSDREAVVSFERNACKLDKDFQLYFAPKAQRIAFSLLTQRPSPGDPGYFLLLLSPQATPDDTSVPRDLVIVLDTSGSMDHEKLQQAEAAVIHALDSLGADDRFAVIAFASTTKSFRENLAVAEKRNLRDARLWVEKLHAEGGTDIADGLEFALRLREKKQTARTFQVVLLTDGLPTVGVTDPKKILENIGRQAGEGMRIYAFGVGDDVDTQLLDSLAESTRGTTTYVRAGENLESKVSAFTAKIERPVRTGLELQIRGGQRIVEMYPPQIPDLFHGEQLQVVGRYEGHGHATLTLTGRAGDRLVSDSLETTFPESAADHDFIAPIWARRKVGYLLDQIRRNGESAEIRDELIRLAREYAIATPFTSLLIIPEAAPAAGSRGRAPSTRRRRATRQWFPTIPSGGAGMGGRGSGIGMMGGMGGSMAGMGGMGGGMAGMGGMGGGMAGMGGMGRSMGGMGGGMGGMGGGFGGASGALGGVRDLVGASAGSMGHSGSPIHGQSSRNAAIESNPTVSAQPSSGKEAVDLAQQLAELKTGARPETSAGPRTVGGRRFRMVDGAWVDQEYTKNTPSLRLRVLGKAYFKLVGARPQLRMIFALGKRITWISPSGTAVIIDSQGQDDADQASLDRLFDNAG